MKPEFNSDELKQILVILKNPTTCDGSNCILCCFNKEIGPDKFLTVKKCRLLELNRFNLRKTLHQRKRENSKFCKTLIRNLI